MARKTDAARANINARAAISTAGSLAKIRQVLASTAELEPGTIDRALDRAHTIGWMAGIKDYEEGD